MLTKNEAHRIVILSLRLLNGRKGFDYWWYDIDPEDKEDIINDWVNELTTKVELSTKGDNARS